MVAGSIDQYSRATPIYDQMVGHNITSSTASETPRFSNTPNVGADTSTIPGEKRYAGHVGTEGPIGGGTSGDSTHLGGSSHVGDSSHHGDSLRPKASSGAYDGISEASIKSGVIGFTPSSGGQDHAALPINNSAEGNLEPNQVVGQGNIGENPGSGFRNETVQEQPSILPGR